MFAHGDTGDRRGAGNREMFAHGDTGDRRGAGNREMFAHGDTGSSPGREPGDALPYGARGSTNRQRGATAHSPHFGRRASQIRRPWVMRFTWAS
jgi:hypothetical protein